MTTTVDYDAPRQRRGEAGDDDSSQVLRTRDADIRSGAVELDETDLNEALELPGADLSNLLFEQELTAPIVPIQADEFTCSRCFLIYSRSRLTHGHGHGHQSALICRDCA